MAKSTQDEKQPHPKQGQPAEKIDRMGQVAARAGGSVMQAGADALQHNAAALQNAVQTGAHMLAQVTEHSAEQFGRMLSSVETGRVQPMQQSARNIEAMASSMIILAQGLDIISRAWLEFARERTERTLKLGEELVNCRSPQAFLAVQSDLARENLEGMLQIARRVAELSLRVTGDATARVTERIEQAGHDAA